MDSIESPQTSSGERLSFFQIFFTKNLNVEIPIIQRDYAQGRDVEIEVRTAFIDALHGYLKEGVPFRDLDFVYGSILNDKQLDNFPLQQKPILRFIPLDGQQRLTTLFLLHWYLAQISGKSDFLRQTLSEKGRSKFSYETRSSSKEFCDALIANDINFEQTLKDDKENESLALTIKDRSWFFLSWEDDPTIRSMLTMLDAIHKSFKGCGEYFDKLVDLNEPVITFRFLNLQEFNLTDDLYIKMNARGKPLSYFENFKAQFEKSIKRYDGVWPEYRLKFRREPVSGYEYFIHKIDTDWADLFWVYRNEATSDSTFDDEIMNFIAQNIANYEILRVDIDSEYILKSRERLFGAGGKLNSLSFMDYDSLGCLSKQQLIHQIEMFDLLSYEKTIAGHLTPYLKENVYYNEEKILKKIISNNSTYFDKLRFYAFYAGISQGLLGENLLSWMRVIFNLTENTIINTVDEYHRALKSIRDLVEHEDSIHELLKQDVSISLFADSQVFEEKIKAHLMDKSIAWKNAIIKVENHPFFRGQIGFILKFSGIVDYYIENKNTNWGDSDQVFLENFHQYVKSASAVFTCIEHNSSSINYAWERAVLTKGNYLTTSSASRSNLLSARINKNNIERDHSWRRLLRLSVNEGDAWSNKQGFVKAVFDDPNFDAGNVQISLEKICSFYLEVSSSQDWRFLLITKPELFNISNQGFIVINDSEVIVLHELKRNHFHSEIYSKFLELDLIDRKVVTTPFEVIKYEPAKTEKDYTFIKLSNFSYMDEQYLMEIRYSFNQYLFLFRNLSNRMCHSGLINVLEGCEFYSVTNLGVENLSHITVPENAYIIYCKTIQQALDKLKEVCQMLSKLN